VCICFNCGNVVVQDRSHIVTHTHILITLTGIQ
jgi:hypothetical protein